MSKNSRMRDAQRAAEQAKAAQERKMRWIVIAAVAVVPEYRHRGLGSRISRFLVKRILEKGKTPRLISGYDEVAELYRQVGFETCGRWGELYL